MKIPSLAAATALTLVVSLPAHAALTFNPFVSSGDLSSVLGQNNTIGFAYAGDKFVGSVYFGGNNAQLYSTNLSGGGVAKFGTPIAGFSGEVYVTSSLGLGGYGPRDVFAGSEAGGQVWRVAHDGSAQSLFATVPVGSVRSIAFDPYGLYGFNMIVATNAGAIYKVSNGGVVTLLANVGEDAEGLSFAPQAFGPYAKGTLMVASEGSGKLRAIAPDGTKTDVVTITGGAEMVSFVPLNLGASGNPVEGFYAANYPNDIVKADASQFLPYLGDAVITSEISHDVWDVKWDAISASFSVTNIGLFPAQPEDGIFVTADIIRGGDVPEPASLLLALTSLGLMGALGRRQGRHQA
jgi:hypothetical protein